MTRDEAESIVMAAEAGVFKGSRGELAQALLLLAAPREEQVPPTSDGVEE